MVPAECHTRTVRVNVPGAHGTGVVVGRHGRFWLVTARHVVNGVDPQDVSIGWSDVTLEPVEGPVGDVDIALFEASRGPTPDLPLFTGAEGVLFGQQVYFLGYPFGLGAGIEHYPFIKGALVSGVERRAGGRVWYLDGLNNPGFSGGPVVFKNHMNGRWQVLSIVSGYRADPAFVEGGGGGYILENTGIVETYDISFALDVIDDRCR